MKALPLGTILSRGPLTPPAAAALGAAVLSGVAALHEAGIAMGGFGASAVRVTGNGDVRLAGHPAAAVRGAPAQSDLRADVRSSGMAVCAAFGVDPAGAPAPPNIPPGLVVTMRSMASGAMGPAADRAQAALREMAAAMLAPDRQVAAQSELALRAGGRETPGVTPFLPQVEGPAAAPAPPAPSPYLPPQPREETPIRAPVSYDAPPRPMQTYPAIPVPTYTSPSRAGCAGGSGAREPNPVPTWSEAPPRTPAPYEAPVAPAPPATNPPAPSAPDKPADSRAFRACGDSLSVRDRGPDSRDRHESSCSGPAGTHSASPNCAGADSGPSRARGPAGVDAGRNSRLEARGGDRTGRGKRRGGFRGCAGPDAAPRARPPSPRRWRAGPPAAELRTVRSG